MGKLRFLQGTTFSEKQFLMEGFADDLACERRCKFVNQLILFSLAMKNIVLESVLYRYNFEGNRL